MQNSEAYHWLHRGKRRQEVLARLRQPMTAKQLACRTGMSLHTCSYVLGQMATQSLVVCLNSRARASRLYWLTTRGTACQRRLCRSRGLPSVTDDVVCVDWELYGWVCYRHRSAIIKALFEPLSPATIKRRARSQNPALRMSANNVRDVIRLFLERGIAKRLMAKGKAHPRYTLTAVGRQLNALLQRAPPL